MSDYKENFPTELLDIIRNNPDKYRILRELPYSQFNENYHFPIYLADVSGEIQKDTDDERTLVLLDTETTGLDIKNDELIELAIVRVKYSYSTGKFICIEGIYDGLEQPCNPISEKIAGLTGITNEMVHGQKLDEARVLDLLRGDKVLVVAHNAAFDRKVLEKRFAGNVMIENLPWACSMEQIDWPRFDPHFKSRSLEVLLSDMGYWYEAHRAIVDCLALLWLLQFCPLAFRDLRLKQARKMNLVYFEPVGIEAKDFLKNNGFRFNAMFKRWEKEIEVNNNYAATIDWLLANVKEITRNPNVEKIERSQTPYTRYK